MQDEILAVVEASAARRWAGVGMLGAVGLLVIYVAVAAPPAFGWQVFLIVVGILALLLAQRLYAATEHRVELTEDELRSSNGTLIARVSDIESMDRGVFAFKPSNGFLLKTRISGPRAWAPGLWWRLGKRVGIGGVTAATQTKFMSETLAALLAANK